MVSREMRRAVPVEMLRHACPDIHEETHHHSWQQGMTHLTDYACQGIHNTAWHYQQSQTRMVSALLRMPKHTRLVRRTDKRQHLPTSDKLCMLRHTQRDNAPRTTAASADIRQVLYVMAYRTEQNTIVTSVAWGICRVTHVKACSSRQSSCRVREWTSIPRIAYVTTCTMRHTAPLSPQPPLHNRTNNRTNRCTHSARQPPCYATGGHGRQVEASP